MVLWLRVLAALEKDLGSIPSTPMVAHKSLELQSERIWCLFWFVHTLHIHPYTENKNWKRKTTKEGTRLQLQIIGGLEYQPQHPNRIQLRFAIAFENLANWSEGKPLHILYSLGQRSSEEKKEKVAIPTRSLVFTDILGKCHRQR